MRAVASDVGLTGPGLYRYVNSMAELRLLLIHNLIGAAHCHISSVGDLYDEPLDKLIASSIALRMWALTFPAEFRLAFASTGAHLGYSEEELADLAERLGIDALHSSATLGDYFAPIFQQMLQNIASPLHAPTEMVAGFADHATKVDAVGKYSFLGRDDFDLVWLFLYLWSRLYGVIAFEVFQHTSPTTVDSALLFKLTLYDMAAEVGGPLDPEHFEPLINAELARRPVA